MTAAERTHGAKHSLCWYNRSVVAEPSPVADGPVQQQHISPKRRQPDLSQHHQPYLEAGNDAWHTATSGVLTADDTPHAQPQATANVLSVSCLCLYCSVGWTILARTTFTFCRHAHGMDLMDAMPLTRRLR